MQLEVIRHPAGSSVNFYRPQHSCGKVLFLHLSVILFTGGGGGGIWQTPPWADPTQADIPQADPWADPTQADIP